MPTHQELNHQPAPSCVVQALGHLLRAAEYARDVGTEPWQFAVEWRELKARGLERTDVRWLVARKLVDLRREISIPAAFQRAFIVHDFPRLTHDTVFILTDAGAAYCRSLVHLDDQSVSFPAPDSTPIAPNGVPRETVGEKPSWDHDRRELRFRGQVVKTYKVPARNQELILESFEEEGWPEFIDDPLPPEDDIEPHRRLQATIKSLNRRQTNNLIRFSGNGGEKVFWRPVRA